MKAQNITENGSFTIETNSLLETSSYYCAWIMIILCVIGLLGNALSICVFSQKHMRNCSINILCIGLSSTDFLLLLTAAPLMALPPLLDSNQLSPAFNTFIHYSVVYVYPVAMMLQTSSVWICSLISAERYLAVCHPLMVRTYCSTRRSAFCLIMVFLFSIFYNIVRFWEYYIPGCSEFQSYPENCTGLVYSDALLKKNKAYLLWFFTVAYLVTHLIPVLIICVLNANVIITICAARKSRKFLTSMQTTEHKTALMMVLVIVNFLLCYTLTFVLNIVEALDPVIFLKQSTRAIAYFFTDISNTLVVFNSACTFLIYTVFSQKYRDTVKWFWIKLTCKTGEPKNTVVADWVLSIGVTFAFVRFIHIGKHDGAGRSQSAALLGRMSKSVSQRNSPIRKSPRPSPYLSERRNMTVNKPYRNKQFFTNYIPVVEKGRFHEDIPLIQKSAKKHDVASNNVGPSIHQVHLTVPEEPGPSYGS